MAVQPDKVGYLVTEKLVKRFDEAVAVDEVSLSIAQGEIFALLGSSGCGKSTFLRMLAGFESPTSGRILLGGQHIQCQDAREPGDQPKKEEAGCVKYVALGPKVTEDRDIKRVD